MTPALEKVNVVLGGGGIKGLVHVGVLDAICSAGFEIGSIVGTSIGALIAAVFAYNRIIRYGSRPTNEAQGKAVEAVRELCLKTDFAQFRDVNPWFLITGGLLKGREIEDWLQTQLWLPDELRPLRLGDLPQDFLTITATNAATGAPIVLDSASEPAFAVHRAVRASASFQWVFREVEIEVAGEPVMCWDGGTSGNCRFDLAARAHPERLTIASSLTYRGQVLRIPRRFPPFVLSRVVQFQMRQMEEIVFSILPQAVQRNVCIVRPPLERAGVFDFSMSESAKSSLIEGGRQETRSALQRWTQSQDAEQ